MLGGIVNKSGHVWLLLYDHEGLPPLLRSLQISLLLLLGLSRFQTMDTNLISQGALSDFVNRLLVLDINLLFDDLPDSLTLQFGLLVLGVFEFKIFILFKSLLFCFRFLQEIAIIILRCPVESESPLADGSASHLLRCCHIGTINILILQTLWDELFRREQALVYLASLLIICTTKIRLLNILLLECSGRFKLVIIVLIIFIFLKVDSLGWYSIWRLPLTIQQIFLLHLHSRRIRYRFFQIFFFHLVRRYDIIWKLLLGICAGHWHGWEDVVLVFSYLVDIYDSSVQLVLWLGVKWFTASDRSIADFLLWSCFELVVMHHIKIGI